MTFEGNGGGGEGMVVPPHRGIPHYHGDSVRIIFVIGAVVLIVAQSTGADLPLSTAGTVISAALLVVAAGITYSSLPWIHYANALFAILGTVLFGTTAIEHYRAGLGAFDTGFIYIEALALLSLLALYFTTRTIRGIHLRKNLVV